MSGYGFTGSDIGKALCEAYAIACVDIAADTSTHMDALRARETEVPGAILVPAMVIVCVGPEIVARMREALERLMAQIGEAHGDAESSRPEDL